MRKNTLALVISSMLMASAAQAQSAAPTDSPGMTPAQSQSQTTGTTSRTDASSTTTRQTSSASDQSNSSDSAAMAQQRWSAADTDRNGTLSKAEMQVSMPTIAANFSKMDVNGDGQLSRDEMHGAKHSTSKAEWSPGFKAADTDRDGSLTLAEAQSGLPTVAAHFSTVDANRDGKLTQQEMAAHQQSMKSNGSDASMDADTSTRSSTTTTTTETAADKDKPDAGSSR